MPITLALRNDAELITTAYVEAGRALGMTLNKLAQVIGVSDSAMKNYSRGSSVINSKKDQELSLGLIRAYRALFAILGGNQEQMQHWLHTPNHHFGDISPSKLVESYQGLAQVNVYLDAMRGRL